ncbi:MAG: ribulose-phosphate 3-epimerase [Simkaniaceae bacterium]
MKSKNKIKIEPSLFAADFGYLADEAKRAEDAGADALHFDIMDGHFVPNLSLSTKSLEAVNRACNLFLDVHIMVYNPEVYIEKLVQAGADNITFHFEATENIEKTLAMIQQQGIEAGLAFCPDTSKSFLPQFIDKCNVILLMTVNPGFGGQAFNHDVLEKISFLREQSATLDIQVDGGIDDKTAPLCIQAGANRLVSGTYLFRENDMRSKIKQLRKSRELSV